MPQSGTSGSVGAVGGQPPAATRPASAGMTATEWIPAPPPVIPAPPPVIPAPPPVIPAPPPVIPAKLVPDPDRGAGIHSGQRIPKLGV